MLPKKFRSGPDRPHVRRVTDGPLPDRLTPTERKIFELLTRRKGQFLTKERICGVVYASASDPPFDTVISVHIIRIRRKLAGTSQQIQSKWGCGYRLVDAAR